MKLDDAFFKLIDSMERFIAPGSEPSLINAKTLVVKGPVKFSQGEGGKSPESFFGSVAIGESLLLAALSFNKLTTHLKNAHTLISMH